MRVLLTGASGMVGHNLLEHPLASNYEFLTPTSSELNLLDFTSTEHYLKRYTPDLIIHAAGRVGGIQANIQNPVRFLLENLDMGRNLVWAAFQTGTKRLINLGSSCMYPRNATHMLKEEDVLQGELEPTNEGYALAKVTVARLCQYISRENPEFYYKTIIPCNLYGRWDKFNPEHSHLIPAVIHKIFQAKKDDIGKIEIWGDGTVRREFMYAGDLADFLIKAIEDFSSMPFMINAGLGYDFTINEYYQMIADIVGYSGQFVHDLSKPVGMQRKLVDVSLQKEWGWAPKISLQDGLEKTYRFYLEHIAKIDARRV